MATNEQIARALSVLECEHGATREDVKASYRELVRVWHPDRFDADAKLKARATEKMKAINAAFEFLESIIEEYERWDREFEEMLRDDDEGTTDQGPDPAAKDQPQQKNYEVGREDVTIVKERNPESGKKSFKKTVSKVVRYDGRMVRIQNTVWHTRPVQEGEDFDAAARTSMSFVKPPEQGTKAGTWDYGSSLNPSDTMGGGNSYNFPDGSSVSIEGYTTDTWFYRDDLKSENGKRSDQLQAMAEAYENFRRRRDWSACLEIAQRAVKLHYKDVWSWIVQAEALHGANRTREALERLKPAANYFRDNITVVYNLACYSALLGEFTNAQKHLRRVFEIAEKAGPYQFERYKAKAEKDPELAALRGSIPNPPVKWKIKKLFGLGPC